MRKTIYVRDEDEEIFERAGKFTEETNLSRIISEALKKFVQEKEAEVATAKGFERIVITFRDSGENNLPKGKAFHGSWIIPPKEPVKVEFFDHDLNTWYSRYFCVATTAKGNIVIYGWMLNNEKNRECETVKIFPSFEGAMKDEMAAEAARMAFERHGVPIEELDI